MDFNFHFSVPEKQDTGVMKALSQDSGSGDRGGGMEPMVPDFSPGIGGDAGKKTLGEKVGVGHRNGV